MTLAELCADKEVYRGLRGNRFMHGFTSDGEPPASWCQTFFPSLVCTCGEVVLLWDGYADLVAQGEQLYAFPTALPFVHADDPATGEGPLCETASQELVCTCGRFLLQWDEAGDMP